LYTTHRDFPAAFDQAREVPLDFRQANVLRFGDLVGLGDLGVTRAEIDAADALVLPRGRELRLTLRAVADRPPGYFASGADTGKPVQVRLHRPSAVENGL